MQIKKKSFHKFHDEIQMNVRMIGMNILEMVVVVARNVPFGAVALNFGPRTTFCLLSVLGIYQT